MGEYKEILKSGGELVVSPNDWYISYYFSGPDMRYNGTWKRISSKEVDNYINAWKSNFDTYKQLKKELNLDGTFEKTGAAGMKISIGGYRDGVCIDSWHMNIRTQEQVDQIIQDYKNAKSKAIRIQEMLKQL